MLSGMASRVPHRIMLHYSVGNSSIKLPKVNTTPIDLAGANVQDAKAKQKKQKMKEYADEKASVKPTSINVGNQVLITHDPIKANSQLPYHPDQYQVTKQKGCMITAAHKGRKSPVTLYSSLTSIVHR